MLGLQIEVFPNSLTVASYNSKLLQNLLVLVAVACHYLTVQWVLHLNLPWERSLYLEKGESWVVQTDIDSELLMLELLGEKLEEPIEYDRRVFLISELHGVHIRDDHDDEGV